MPRNRTVADNPPDHIPDPRQYAARTTEEVLAKAIDRMELLNERGSTHGDFEANAEIMQETKKLWRAHLGWLQLTLVQREALEMIAIKIGRILCGDPNYYDHWRDIAGYAKLVEERCPKPTEGLR